MENVVHWAGAAARYLLLVVGFSVFFLVGLALLVAVQFALTSCLLFGYSAAEFALTDPASSRRAFFKMFRESDESDWVPVEAQTQATVLSEE